MWHVISAWGVAHDLHTTAPWLLEHTWWRQFAAQQGDCTNLELPLPMWSSLSLSLPLSFKVAESIHQKRFSPYAPQTAELKQQHSLQRSLLTGFRQSFSSSSSPGPLSLQLSLIERLKRGWPSLPTSSKGRPNPRSNLRWPLWSSRHNRRLVQTLSEAIRIGQMSTHWNPSLA